MGAKKGTIGLSWEDPPPADRSGRLPGRRSKRRTLDPLIEELKLRPGTWAKIVGMTSMSTAVKAVYPGVEFVTRVRGKVIVGVWARWTGACMVCGCGLELEK